jgi:hypothetical protein
VALPHILDEAGLVLPLDAVDAALLPTVRRAAAGPPDTLPREV